METLQTSVLLVDDDPANIATLEAVLEPLGQRLVRALSGREALRCVLEEDFAVILLDVRLGDMSGLEVMQLLRERERNRRTPVLLMTAADLDAPQLVLGYTHGAVDYMSKPLIAQVLRSKVAVFVELQQAREQLRRQERREREYERARWEAEQSGRLHALLMQAPVAIAITRGPDFIYEFANPCYERMMGRAIPTGQPLRELFPEMAAQPHILDILRRVMETGESFVGSEFPVLLDRSGTGEREEAFFDFVYQASRGPRGEVTGIVSFCIEVTQHLHSRRRADRLAEELRLSVEALHTSEERLRLALASTSLGTWDFDPASGQLRWDARSKELFGLPAEAEVSYPIFESRLHPDDRAATNAAVASSLDPEGSGGYDIEYRTVALPGVGERWLRATGRAYFQDERPVRFIGTLKDISVVKRAEHDRVRLLAEARHRAEQLRGLSETAVALNGEGDVASALRLVAERARALVDAEQCGVGLKDGQDWDHPLTAVSVADPSRRDEVSRPENHGLRAEVYRTHQPLRLTQAALRAHPAWTEAPAHAAPPPRGWLAVPLLDREGQHLGLIQLSDKQGGDFTEDDEAIIVQLAQLTSVAVEIRRLNAGLEDRVRERTAQLQEANKELESFSYSVSHDLRAPLRHITGFAQLLERRAGAALDDVARGHLRTITRAAHQGGTLVDDLLAFSRMGRAELRRSEVSLDELLQEVLRDLEPECKNRRVEWRLAALPTVRADPSLLRQVLRNLLGTAVKYTRPRDQALIEVGAQVDAHEVQLWVRDNGVGFEMQYVDKLFGVFQRLHTAEQFEGTGIGLANVRRIISRHGGRTWAESVLHEGSTFYFTLPRTAPPQRE